MDLRKLHWRVKLQLDFCFFKLPLTWYGDLRLQNPLPARGAESVVAYLLFGVRPVAQWCLDARGFVLAPGSVVAASCKI